MGLRAVILWAFLHLCTGESVIFPSGETLNSVDDLSDDTYASSLNTSSLLFDSEGLDTVSLSVYVPVSRWKSPDRQYFRANPTFIACLQNTSTALSAEDKPIEIAEGYRTAADSPSSEALTSGEAVVVRLTNATSGTVEDIVRVAIQQCVPVFEDVQRNLGITVTDDTVLIQLRPDDGEDLGFQADWWTHLDAAYDLPATPTCDEDTELTSDGDKYPSTATSAEAEAGSIDYPITRDTEDFKQLVQYPASHILFADEESSSSWCGTDGTPCNPCASHPVGFTTSERCADRVMSKRLFTALLRVDKHVRTQLNARLRVTEAWDEPHSAAEDGDQEETSLHYEGRAAKLELSGSSDLTSLAKYCICADIDYIEHKGTYLLVAVQKQEGYSSNYIEFDNEALVPVLPDSQHIETYEVEDVYTRSYLFDSDGKEDKNLCDDATVGDFKDPDERYFRVDPALVKCYQAISSSDNKYNSGDRRKIVINVGYRSTPAQSNEYGINDPRYTTFNRGYAMQLSYESDAGLDSTVYNPARLAVIAASQCGKLFKNADVSMGLGLYTDSIFVDMRSEQELWVESSDALPDGMTEDEWFDKTDEYILASEEDRIIEPDDPVSACLDFNPPQQQSVDFQHPSSAKRRKKRSASDVCTPASDTTYCSQTTTHRDLEVEHVMSMVTRKHLEGDLEDRLRAALQGCTGACGTCMEGSVWDSKVENCNNFMHWVPFTLGNNESDVTNIHDRNNANLKADACNGHCIVKAPLFSLLVQSVDERYRPDPAQSAEQDLYSSQDNPLPIMDLLYRLYAMHARGEVTVWVETVEEINMLKSSLEVVLVYNKDVTGVTIYVTDGGIVADVEVAARKFVEDWATSACTDYTRDTIAPLTVEAAPEARRRRSPEYDLREELLERERKWEERWMQSKLRSGGGM